MSFAIFLLYLALTFLRPGEQFAQLREWAVMDIASGLALAAGIMTLLSGRAPAVRSVQVLLVLGLWTWALLSIGASPLRSMEALDRVLGFGKSSCFAFVMVVLSVSSLGRFRLVAATLSLLTLLIALQAALGWNVRPMVTGPGARSAQLELAEAPPLSKGEDAPPAAPGTVLRFRGVGAFGDPNDFAVMLLAVLPLCFTLRRAGAPMYNALFVWIPIGLIMYSVYLTRSRTGALTLAAILMLSMRHKVGTVLSVGAGWLALSGIIAMGFLGGRALEMDKSAMGRVFAWSDGLQMLKSSPIWGVGFGMFTQYHERAAHSAFVNCFAELGFIGYMFWCALIVLTLDDLRFVQGVDHDGKAGLKRWANALIISIAGSMVGGLFLSRSFDVLLFIQLALGTALADVARREGHLTRSRSVLHSLTLTLAVALVSIIGVWVYMRIN
jgi:hypothetical protein